MKFSLLATAIVALALAGCGKPHQANPESIEGYGTRTEEGTTVAEERAAAGEVSETADPSSFDVKDSTQAADTVNDPVEAAVESVEGAVEGAVESIEGAAAAVEDEYSGKAVLPGHNLDGNGNPITDGKDPTKLMH